MIYPSLNAIAEQLNTSIYEKWGATINGTSEIVQLNNIASINDEKNDLQNKIIFTLIKVEEESSLKNGAFYTKKQPQEMAKHNPAIYLNLYLLVSITKKNYKEALQLLSDTITFFQAHKVFTGQLPEEPKEDNFYKITVEQHDISFQEVFDMWSNLGNKHFPSVLYKIRLLRFFDSQESSEAPVIKSIKIHYDTGAR
jgi:hypothetical protein